MLVHHCGIYEWCPAWVMLHGIADEPLNRMEEAPNPQEQGDRMCAGQVLPDHLPFSWFVTLIFNPAGEMRPRGRWGDTTGI